MGILEDYFRKVKNNIKLNGMSVKFYDIHRYFYSDPGQFIREVRISRKPLASAWYHWACAERSLIQ